MERILTVAELRFEIIQLANLYLAAGIPDELISSNLDLAFAKAKAAFERQGQGRILLILDNVATDGVLSDRTASLPSSEFVHVLATTRLDPERWGIPSLRLESLSTADALDLFVKYRPFEIPSDEQQWHRVRSGQEQINETELDSAEWKAAVELTLMRPCLGWGVGSFPLAIEAVREAPTQSLTLVSVTPHNLFLLITAETGGLGLVAWTLLGVGLTASIIGRSERRQSILSMALVLGLVGVLVHNLVDFSLAVPATACIFASILGFLVGKASDKPRKQRQPIGG
jgi:hypothetical protein